MHTSFSEKSFWFIVFLVLLFSFLFMNFTSTYDLLSHEDQLAEYLSALFLFISSLFFLKAVFYLFRNKKSSNPILFILFSVCSILFFLAAGEEISWGQRLFNIPTPDYLMAINDQNELNFHNINKKFFDRLLDRLTIIFVIIGTILLWFKKDKIWGVKAPNIYIVCSFLITPFYRQNNNLNFHHILYLALIVLFIYYMKEMHKRNLMVLLATFIITVFVQIIHSEFNYLFPLHNNSANEFKEFLFCFCVCVYSYDIIQDVISNNARFIKSNTI